MTLPAYEKLGAFYLGKRVDEKSGEATEELVLYDAKDLTTHAMCVGMTGSGKTGLCIGLLEEAAIDGIPAIALDPKGDLGNLLLSFPQLAASDFEPWVDAADAARKGLSVPELASKTAATWAKGLEASGQDGARIQRFRDAVDIAIYTPGSDAGRPLGLLRSFAAPPAAVREDGDALRERVSSAVSGLLGLLGIDADPIRSREHILLSTILDRAWREGRDLSLPQCIHAIQEPGIERIGVLDLEPFFPAKDRFALAMTLNNLLASPGFQAWLSGEPLDVHRLLYTPAGKPRLSILSIAHLSDPERMFFTTLLLNELVAWMRSQPGSTSLRALFYMDEVFGYLPPTANPPSKIPMLTLLKQARAYGLGIVLATQNPVDLDYKALSNMGTWFLGRLQTERDKARVLDGLEGATASASRVFDRAAIEAQLSGLPGRTFLMNNVHDDEPILFQTRWVLSYLAGPLTRAQIKRLHAATPGMPRPHSSLPAATEGVAAPVSAPGSAPDSPPHSAPGERPILAPDVPQRFVVPIHARRGQATLVYQPALVGEVHAHFVEAKRGLDLWRTSVRLLHVRGEVPARLWDESRVVGTPLEFESSPVEHARFAALPSAAAQAKSYTAWQKALIDHTYQHEVLERFACADPKDVSQPNEAEGDFRARLQQILRERRDLEMTKVKERFGTRASRLESRLRTAEQRLEKERAQLSESKRGSWLRFGETLLGAIFGRRRLSAGTIGKAGTTMRGMGRSKKEALDVEQAEADLGALQQELKDLNAEMEAALDDVRERTGQGTLAITSERVRPRKADLRVGRLVLAWLPHWVGPEGMAEPAWDAGGA